MPARAVDQKGSSVSPPASNGNGFVKFEDNPICKVECIDAHPACEESQKVIDTLKEIYEAFGRRDVQGCGKYFDENCSTFDEQSKQLISGKQAVMEDVRKKIERLADDKESPLVSYTIEHPYAQVKGDTAVVTFTATKVFGGKHPRTLQSHCTDIFVKKDGKWLKLHYRANWKPVAS
ncbi:MAG: YybH family protein [Terriglobales bacterium]